MKVFAGHDGALYEESYNLLNAWLAVVPGNASHNLRRLPLLNTNVADLSFLFTLAHGRADERPPRRPRVPRRLRDRASDAVLLESALRRRRPHADPGRHRAAASRSSLNFIITHAQKYDPVTVIFDLGGSYEKLTTLLGGSVWRMGLAHRAFTINPFCLEPTRREPATSCSRSCGCCCSRAASTASRMQDDRDLYEAVENIYALDPPQRRLFTLANLLPRALAQHLHRWVQGGPYAALFDNVEDTLTFQRVQCFDFEGLEQVPARCSSRCCSTSCIGRAPSIQRRATPASQLKLFVLDEAWRFAQDATLKAYITEALKTWRKRNAAMLLATQSSEDFVDARPAPHGRRELSDEVLSGESRAWTSTAPASCSI